MVHGIFKKFYGRNIILLTAAILVFSGMVISAFHYHDDDKMHNDCPVYVIQDGGNYYSL